MNHFGRLLVLAALAGVLHGEGTCAYAQVKAGAAPTSGVDGVVKDLQSDSADVRQGAEVRLYAMGSDDFAAIDAASKRKDLKPAAAASLKAIVEAVRPLNGKRTRTTRVRIAERQWAEQTALASYNAVGKRNPKWDQAVKDAVIKSNEPGEALDQYGAIDKAVQLGCDDPMLRAIYARFCHQMNLADGIQLQKDLAQTAEALAASRYPASLKLAELNYAIRHNGHPLDMVMNGKPMHFQPAPGIIRMQQKAMELWSEAVKEEDVPENVLIARGQELAATGEFTTGETKSLFDKVYAVMDKEPRHKSAALVLKGRYYIAYAWEARGSGTANTVSPEDFKQMQERLVLASEALAKAYDLNPNDVEAPLSMLVVELGQAKGKEILDLWFKRAMKADPDSYEACQRKLYYLEPKWYGSPEEMLAFARECRDSKNWYGKLPMLLPEAHDRLSKYAPTPEQYFQLPGVWADIQSVYVPMLNAWPKDARVRSRYAYYASMCGQWAEATRQFNQLGDDAVGREFGNDDKMASLRERAKNGGK